VGEDEVRVEGSSHVPDVQCVLAEAHAEHPRIIDLHSEEAELEAGEPLGVDGLEALEEGRVCGMRIRRLGCRRLRVLGIPDRPEGLLRRLAALEAGVDEEPEDLGLAAEVAEHVGDVPGIVVGGPLKLALPKVADERGEPPLRCPQGTE